MDSNILTTDPFAYAITERNKNCPSIKFLSDVLPIPSQIMTLEALWNSMLDTMLLGKWSFPLWVPILVNKFKDIQ